MTRWQGRPGPFDDPLGYPGPIPDGPFSLVGGRVEVGSPGPCDGRLPLVATGSNASPPQLWRKLGTDATVPVVPAVVDGLDVRYSAHITRYGAMPSTGWGEEGAESAVRVLFLTPEQLDRLDRSEPTYDRRSLAQVGATAALAAGELLDPAEVGVYLSKRGWYRLDGGPVRPPGHGRAPVLAQEAVLATVLDLVRERRPADAPGDVRALALGARGGAPPLTPAGLTALIAEAGRAGR